MLRARLLQCLIFHAEAQGKKSNHMYLLPPIYMFTSASASAPFAPKLSAVLMSRFPRLITRRNRNPASPRRNLPFKPHAPFLQIFPQALRQFAFPQGAHGICQCQRRIAKLPFCGFRYCNSRIGRSVFGSVFQKKLSQLFFLIAKGKSAFFYSFPPGKGQGFPVKTSPARLIAEVMVSLIPCSKNQNAKPQGLGAVKMSLTAQQ